MNPLISSTLVGTAGNLIGGLIQNQIQNYQSKKNVEHAARVNYGYGEMAADSADARTRALYSSLYSPEAKVKQLKEAGLSVGLMYGQGGAGGTSSTAGAQGQGAGGQQGKQPIGMLEGAQLGLMAAQTMKLKAEADNLNQDKDKKEKETLKLGEEIEKIKQEVVNLKGEKALQGWSQRQLMTISDSEFKSYSEGKGWTKGWSVGNSGSWSEGSSQGTSQSKGEQGGLGIGYNVGVRVLGTGGNVGGNVNGNYGYNKGESQNTSQNRGASQSQSKSKNSGENESKSEATSTSGTRNVIVWPQYDAKGNLEYLYMYLLTGDYRNISTEFRKE